MLLMLVIALPMYVCAIASVPIAAALVVSGGLPAGAALVFLMAGPATNIATLGAITKSFGKRITGIYLLTISVFSVIFGLVFDWVIVAGPDAGQHAGHAGHSLPHWLEMASTIGLAALMVGHAAAPAIRRWLQRRKEKQIVSEQEISLTVKGMTCQNCVRHVQKALSNVEGVAVAEVNLDESSAKVRGEDLDAAKLAAAVQEAGYETE